MTDPPYALVSIVKARVASGLRLAPKPAAKPANDNGTLDLFGASPAAKTNGGGVGASMENSQTKSLDTNQSAGGIMAGKGGFGFRIREQRNKAKANKATTGKAVR